MNNQNGAVPQQNSHNFSFTNRRLDQLKKSKTNNETKQIEYSDATCRGLKLIHNTRTDRKTFYQRYYPPNGKRNVIKIGEYPAVRVERAREITNANKALLTQGVDPAQQPEEQVKELTFKQFAEQIYLPEAEIRKNSWIDDKRKLEKDMYKTFGEKLLIDITKGEVTQYINSIRNRTSNSTANRHRALLSSIFNMAIDHDILAKNNVQHIPKYPESTDHGRSLTPQELKNLMGALETAINPISALAIKLLLATGMRKSECLQMEWHNIDFIRCVAKLEMETTKGKRARNVILNPSAIAILKELESLKKVDNPYVFPSKNGTHLATVRKTFESCKKSAGIKDLRLHDCRHTFCSILANAGTSLYTIQNLVGHRSPAMTQRYSHLNAEALQAASQTVSNHLELATAA